MISEDKRQIVDELNKELKDSAIFIANEVPSHGLFPTGIHIIDKAILGGIPEGRITLLHGRPHGGKSTVAYSAIAEYQKKHPKKLVVYIDTELAFPTLEEDEDGELKSWATILGIDLSRLLIMPTAIVEDVGDSVEFYTGLSKKARELNVGLVVIDSLAVLKSRDELGKATGEFMVAGSAKHVSQMITTFLANQGKRANEGMDLSTLILINHQLPSIGGFAPSEDVLPKGRQQLYLSSTRIELNPYSVAKNKLTDSENDNGSVFQSKHRMKVKKYRGSGYQDDVTFILQTLDEGYHPNKCNYTALANLTKEAKSYGVIKVTDTDKGRVIHINGLELDIASDAWVEELQLNSTIVDYISSCIVMIERMRVGRSPLPLDKYIHQWFDVVPPFVYEEFRRMGKVKQSSRMLNKNKTEVTKGI